jgi:glycogen debranching enzyme
MVGRRETALKRDPSAAHRERKRRVLTHSTPSATSRIADAVVMKDGNLFFLCDRDGRVPLEEGHGLGLYFNDCRYLDGYELAVAGQPLGGIAVNARRGFRSMFELTNADLFDKRGRPVAAKEEIGVQWKRSVDGRRAVLHDEIVFHNYGPHAVRIPVSFAFRAQFQDVFEVRGLVPPRRAKRATVRWQGHRLVFRYPGADDVRRTLQVHFFPSPRHRRDGADFVLRLSPGAERRISIALRAAEGPHWHRPKTPALRDAKRAEKSAERKETSALASQTEITSDHFHLTALIDRSLRDLRMLRSSVAGETYLAAGTPWFSALFGRDSLVCALFTLAFDASLADQTLRLLAALQGDAIDEHRDEEPGKILHELRVGELARSGRIPHTPYYGSVDATPLFLIVLACHAQWTGKLDLFRALEPNVERALDWIDHFGDRDGDGYVAYDSETRDALINQGWKDSGDAIVRNDGRIARPPIALVEVQAYVYYARQLIAALYARTGRRARARQLLASCRKLRAKFNRDFWYQGERTYDLALQAGGEPTRVVSSNAGHALWAGIADKEKGRHAAMRLLDADLFNGWGVRTLSAREACYNPLSYHRGSVWPHDNAILVAGLRRHGRDREALAVFEGLLDAARHFDNRRLPELFCGSSRDDYEVPVRYPVACHPQAWAAASFPYMLTTMLGLVPDAFAKRLRIVRPILPESIRALEVKRLRVGGAEVDLAFERARSGVLKARVTRRRGKLSVTP